MRVKEIDRTANVAWSPAEQHPIYIAAGTAAQQLDATFSTSAALEIYSMNLGEPGLEMEPIGTLPSDFRFHKLAWGSRAAGKSEEDAGLLVGGADNGNIFVWDPTAILKGEEPLVHRLQKHNGAVAALDFNPFQSNLLASGASESEIYIWDLNNTANPMTPGSKSQPPDDVTCVSWNQQVQHILASTYAGRCVVWDLRKNEPIIKVSDSMSRIKCKLVAWHPEVATQMCLSSEDDHSPVIQLWDLRFATSPLKVLENHTRGILSIAWCPQDPDLLLSCGKDNRILCWNPNSQAQMGEVVYELPTSNQWCFDVQWCPRNPSVISSCSFDGHIGVYSLMGGSQPPAAPSSKIADSFPTDPFAPQAPEQSSQQEQPPVVLKKPPKWIRRPVGATFGFGGKLITFGNHKPANPQQPVSRQVHISQVVTETDLVARSTQLENALNNSQLAEFCSMKVANSRNDLEENVWNFMKVHFEKDPRTLYLNLLGYDQNEIAKKVVDLTGEETSANNSLSGVDAGELAQKMAQLDPSRGSTLAPFMPSGGGASPRIDRIQQTPSEEGLSVDGAEAFEKISKTEIEQAAHNEPLPFSVKDDCDGLVTQALLTANFQAAVEVCLHNDRMAEAMILAMAGGPELMQQTQKRFFQKQQDNLSRLISSVVTRDYEQIVKTCDLKHWKEALAVSLTYAKAQQFASLCDILGSRLEAERDQDLACNAVLCYICAGNIPKLVECWSKISNNSNSPNTLQDLVEKVMILRKALEAVSGTQVDVASGLLAEKLTSYSELLAAQGSLATAVHYLGTSNELSLAILRDRLCEAIPNYQGAATAKPFNVLNVQPEGAARQPAQPANPQVAPNQRQRSNSGYYQANSGNFQTSTTPTYSNYNQYNNTSSYSQAPVNTYTQPTNTYTQPGYNQPGSNAASVPSSISKGPLSQKYPSYQQPNTGGYSTDQYNPANIYQPPTSYGGYGGGNYPGTQPQPGSVQQPNIYNPLTTPGAPTSTSQPGNPQQPPLPDMPSYQHTPTAEPGWNDPPPIRNRKTSTNNPAVSQPNVAPITTPIYGVPQPAEQNPPGAPTYMGNTQVYNPQDYQAQQAAHQPVAKPEPPKPVVKGPIPAENQLLQQIFDKLANQCLTQSTNPHIKRKLEDVLRKLEALYDKLREESLSQNVTLGLHQIVQSIQAYDYQTALAYHAQMVSQGNFSEISSFMPGVKMLMQTAMQMNVYVQQ